MPRMFLILLGDRIMFKNITVENWRQFHKVDIELHPTLTVLTGANGAGKTTILNILSSKFGWDSKFVSSYEADDSKNAHYTNSKIHEDIETSKGINETIGNLTYYVDSDNQFTTIEAILVPKQVSETYNIRLSVTNQFSFVGSQLPNAISPKKEEIRGLFINSHRPIFSYQKLASVPINSTDRSKIFNEYLNVYKKFVFDENRSYNEMSGSALIKTSLIALAMFGYGNQNVTPNSEMRALFEEYLEILKIVLPEELGFKDIKIRIPEVLFITDTGEFPIDALSGGISSLLDITWQIFMFDKRDAKFVVIIDEPENHLHPKLQKTLMRNLIRAFSNVQFIVATHNPFIITSVKDSNVYVLCYEEETHRVISEKLDYVNRAGSSNEILRDVLGVDTSIPYWAEDEYNEVVKNFVKQELSEVSILRLQENLKKIGLERLFPDIVTKKTITEARPK